MALCCAISNDVPEHPVVSPVSGSIFEKRLVEKYVIENGVDPINGKELSIDQLIEIKTPPLVKPKPPSATSIPAILKTLQDEWDAMMLHGFTQRQQLQTARQELSHSLYQHDAACRVIARLSKEVAAAREALATLKPQAGVAAPQPGVQHVAAGVDGGPQVMEEIGMTDDIIQKLQDKATVLTQERKRKGRTVPEDLASVENLRNLRTLASYPGLHSASGILALDIHAADTSKMVTGGNDGNAVVFNKDLERRLATLEGHSKKVTRVIYHPEEDLILTASPDKTIRVWDVSKVQTTDRPLTVEAIKVLEVHEEAVTGLSLHPTGDYVLSTSADHHWAFTDIRTGKLLTKVSDDSTGMGLTTAQFHPDGLIFGTGTSDSQVKIWDLKEQSNVANFPGHSGPITAIAFSENGYYLATAAEDACVKLWDLRKLKNFKTLQLDERYEIKDLCFDQSGTYLAVAGTDVRLYVCKQWQELKVLKEHKEGHIATGVRFGRLSHFLASTSMDRSLKIYGV